MNEIMKSSILCSQLGHRIINGNITAVKHLYGNLWKEHPALIRTTSQLQDCLTSVEIEQHAGSIYSPEFLYYWGMSCLGEQSSLLIKNLGTAETCFRKIESFVPVVKARLAYINLLQSDLPAKSEQNIACIETLRKCGAYQRDLFSSIVLSKIVFHCFLEERQEYNTDNQDLVISELPIKAMRLLQIPCQERHPVAIRFWNSMIACIGTPDAMSKYINESWIFPDALYDFKTSANMQIGP